MRGKKILYRDIHDPSIIQHGFLESVKDGMMQVQQLTFTQFGKYHGCPKFDSHRLDAIISVPISNYKGHFELTGGFVNSYVLLNLVRK